MTEETMGDVVACEPSWAHLLKEFAEWPDSELVQLCLAPPPGEHNGHKVIAATLGQLRRASRPAPSEASADVVEDKLDRDWTKRSVHEVMDEGDGFWRPCSGCQEGVDGYVSQKDYPYSDMFRCQPGAGCSECGGIGVTWDDTDYEEYAKFALELDEDKAPQADALREVWNQARENHRNYSATGDTEQDIRFFGLGLAGEAGEVANFIKKRWRDGDGHDTDLRAECADVFAYNIMLADALGMSPADLIAEVARKQQVFIEKMKARQNLTESPTDAD